MTNEEHMTDALYEIAREIKKTREDVWQILRNICSHLEDISGGVAEINKNTPNILDRE